MDFDHTTVAPSWEHQAAVLRERVMRVFPASQNADAATERLRREFMDMLHYRSLESEMQVRDDVPRLLAEILRAADEAA
ncbi:MAG: hypothetical protein ACR2OH_00295 [Microthrixaceae bacterium]